MSFCMQIWDEKLKSRKKMAALLPGFVFAICLLLIFPVWKESRNSPVQNGCVDLRDVDLSGGKSIQLCGEWEYFDKRLIVTEMETDALADGLVSVPSFQKGHFGETGWGSYRIRLLNCPPEMQITVSLRGMPSAYRIFLNGKSLEKSGLVSRGASMKIEAGFREESSEPLRSSTCELVVEVSGQWLPGLSVAPVLMEKGSYSALYQKYQAAVFSLFGAVFLFVIAYATGLILTPGGGYSVFIFLAILLLLLQGISVDVIFRTVFGEWGMPYDAVLLVSFAGRLAAWNILLRRSRKKFPARSIFSIVLFGIFAVCLAAPVAGIRYGTTYWWLAAEAAAGLMLIWRQIHFILDANDQMPESVLLEVGLVLLWFGYVLGDFALSGTVLFFYKTAVFAGTLLFHFLIYVVDRSRIRQVQQKALEAAQAEKELEHAKTELALHQIKPHFLHNALMSIKVLCRRDPSEAERAIYDFSAFLRSNMKTIESSQPISFEEELGTIQAYLHIEQIRFGERLKVIWDIQKTDFWVPPLTIQPLVENAVRHGICEKIEGGTVTISSRQETGWILVEIRDDGVGFDAGVSQDFEGIGIKNLRLRLERLLGAELEIISSPGEGCVQIVRIPEKTEEEKRLD